MSSAARRCAICLRIACAMRISYPRSVSRMSSAFGTASSAAFDGVAARKSATKSEIVTSGSCPTAEMTGISES